VLKCRPSVPPLVFFVRLETLYHGSAFPWSIFDEKIFDDRLNKRVDTTKMKLG